MNDMKRVLIIEDNDSLRKDVYEALSFEGYEVIQAENGRIGVGFAYNRHPDIILCDIMMPDMDGYWVLAELRQHQYASLIPFIFITSLADRTNVRNGMELGADDYITKPFTIKELINAINIRLEKYYNLQIGNEVDKIDSILNSKLKNLKQQVTIQQDYISEIFETNNQLTQQLKDKETELFDEVVKAVETGNTLHLFRNQLENEIAGKSVTHEQKELLSGLLNKVNRIGSRKDNWRIFQLKFNQVYPDLVGRITLQFPKLTQLELTIISTLLFNLNSNQVAAMLNISPDSVRKSRYRLKKKLQLGPDESLVKFIHGFQLNK